MAEGEKTTLKDVIKETKSQSKTLDDLANSAKKMKDATLKGTGFFAKISAATSGVPLLGSAFKSLSEGITTIEDGIQATGRMFGIGRDKELKILAAQLGTTVKILEAEQLLESSNQESLKFMEDQMKVGILKNNETWKNMDENDKLAIASSEEQKNAFIEAIRLSVEAETEGGKIEQGKLDKLIEQGHKDEERALDATRAKAAADLSMLESLREGFKSGKEKGGGGAMKGVGGAIKGVGGFVSNMLGDMFGGMAALILGPRIAGLFSKLSMKWMRGVITSGFTKLSALTTKMVANVKAFLMMSGKWLMGMLTSGITKLKMLTSKMVAPIKAFAMMAGKWLMGLMRRALAFMSPPVLIAMAVIGLLAYFKDDIIKWFKKMWKAITGFFENVSWGDMFMKVLKLIFFFPLLIFKLGKKIWGAITGFFEGFSLENMMSKLKDLSIVKWIVNLKDRLVNGLKMMILKIVPEKIFRFKLREWVAKKMGVTLPGSGGGGDEEEKEIALVKDDPAAKRRKHVLEGRGDKSADVMSQGFVKALNENALAKAESVGTINVVSKGGDVVSSNSSNVTHQSVDINNPDIIYGSLLYGK